jgi:hypothetical protein
MPIGLVAPGGDDLVAAALEHHMPQAMVERAQRMVSELMTSLLHGGAVEGERVTMTVRMRGMNLVAAISGCSGANGGEDGPSRVWELLAGDGAIEPEDER